MKIRNILENIILVAIILVIVQMFLDEFSRYMHWSIQTRNILMLSGLFFDVLFSIEFTVRTIAAQRHKGLLQYWIYERGWVDFISSIPLLLLDSGPSAYLLFSGNIHETSNAVGVLNILKVVKAIRVTRILRLVRIIKIFGKIHNVESKMAQHHTATISTTAVFTIISSLLIFSILFENPGIQETDARIAQYNNILKNISFLKKTSSKSSQGVVRSLFSKDENVLKAFAGSNELISRIPDDEFEERYEKEDYAVVEEKGISLYISLVDIHKRVAMDHIKSFFIIIFVVVSFMVIYTRHFVQTISDIIHILFKGFRLKDYNLEVKIREEFRDQEVYKLARFYNNAYLPAKLKRISREQENKQSGLSMKDLMSFKNK